jgi:hypothetical protein
VEYQTHIFITQFGGASDVQLRSLIEHWNFFDKGHKRMISMCKSITFLKSYEVSELWKKKIS